MAPPASAWSKVPCENPAAAPGNRHGHACAVYKDCFYVFGGADGSSILVSDLYEFSFSRKTWKVIPAAGAVPSPRYHHVAVVYKDSLYVFAGFNGRSYLNDLVEYNFPTHTWNNIVVRGGAPPTPRQSISAVVYGASMFCFGDYDIVGPKNDMHEFNFETRTWSLVDVTGTVPQVRSDSSLVVLKDNGILFGGHDGPNFNDVHMFNFAQRTWSRLETKGPTPARRYGHTAVVHSNAMFVFGGVNDTPLNDVHKLTLTTAESCAWEAVVVEGPPASPIFNHAAAVYKSSLIVFGGHNDSGCLNGFTQLRLGADSIRPQSVIPESTLLSDLRRLVDNETMSDITFVVEGIPIYAHKWLCMRCDCFKSMFNSHMRESRAGEIVINDVRHSIFLLFLEFLYTDDIGNVSVEDAMELVAVADRYGVDRLQRICEHRLLLSLCVENAATILLAADLHNAVALREQCVSFVLDNFDAVSKTTAFAEMSCKKVELTLELLQAR